MHFSGDISLGQIVVGAPITAVLYVLLKMHGMLLMFRMEHEILMTDWAGKQVPPIKLHELHTRQKRWW